VTTPAAIDGGLAFRQVEGAQQCDAGGAQGAGFVCGVTMLGAGYSWGRDPDVWLGNGLDGASMASPEPVQGGRARASISVVELRA
jgi:hypothetical protein